MKKTVAILLVFVLMLSFATTGFASYSDTWEDNIDELKYVTAVENQGAQERCLAYALTSTAGSYCIKNCGFTPEKADFDENALVRRIGTSTNYGAVIYSAVNVNLGKNCYITAVEPLSNRGSRYLKQKIKENGAIIAAIALPESGMGDGGADKVFRFSNSECQGSGKFHAFSIVGWNDGGDYWLCKNSYGADWGEKGFFKLSYDNTIVYAACIEVSVFDGVVAVKKPGTTFLNLGYVGAIGFKSEKALTDAQITVSTGKSEIKTTQSLCAGYNTVVFESPVPNGKLELTVNGSEVASSAVNCYIVPFAGTKLTKQNPGYDESWVVDVEKLDISDGTAYSTENRKTINHTVTLKGDGYYYITPKDGYRFTANTKLCLNIKAVNEHNGYANYDYLPVSEYDRTELLPDGRIKTFSYIGNGTAIDRIKITLDESSSITNVEYAGAGSDEFKKADGLTVSYYKSGNAFSQSLDSPGEETVFDPDLDFYFAVITLNNGLAYADEIELIVRDSNGAEHKVPCETRIEGGQVKIGVTVEIPDVTDIIHVLFEIPIALFSKLFELLFS